MLQNDMWFDDLIACLATNCYFYGFYEILCNILYIWAYLNISFDILRKANQLEFCSNLSMSKTW